MTDERQLELAEAHFNSELEREILARRGKVPPEGKLGPAECGECLSEIPMARRKLGYDVCVHCAELAEARARGYR